MVAIDAWRPGNQRSIARWLPLIAGVLVIARVISVNVHPRAEATQLVAWVPVAAAAQLAAAGQKRILYDFTAEWCIPCQQMEEQIYRNPALVAKINRRFVPVRVLDRLQEEGINLPEVDDLKQRYAVMAFPTIVIADPGGGLVKKSEGFVGRRPFEQMIDAAFAPNH